MKKTLLDEARAFASEKARRGGKACSYCALPAEDREAADTLRKEGFAHKVIALWLTERRGHEMTYSKVQNHFENLAAHVRQG